ncbi:MAG: hypothetical protein Q8K55_16200 [Gemmatimonadaceae bacterium]|nr:hypothetical protein [Gemmatimonadaceae bacterium]
MTHQGAPEVTASTPATAVVLVALALVLGNVNAVVDSFLHPEIPYFDPEHLVVGGATASVSAILSVLLLRYLRRLRKALDTIDRLEALLPICANCKRVRSLGSDPDIPESWQPIESYIATKTRTEFSHGICPSCMVVLYPAHAADERVARRPEA